MTSIASIPLHPFLACVGSFVKLFQASSNERTNNYHSLPRHGWGSSGVEARRCMMHPRHADYFHNKSYKENRKQKVQYLVNCIHVVLLY